MSGAMLPRSRVTGALLAVALLGTPAAGAAGEPASSAAGAAISGAGAASDGDTAPSRASLANGCFTIAAAGPFHLEPTGPGTYLLHDPDGRLLAVRDGALARLTGAEQAGPSAEWSVRQSGGGRFTVRATASGLPLTVTAARVLALSSRDTSPRVALVRARGCRRFPEAEVGATGTSPPRRARGGPVVGFADAHLHLTADLRAGGRVIHGAAFSRFGIARALGDDASIHGADGGLDVIGNLLREGLPFGTHDVQGWPAFTGWPVNDTNTHQQAYWVWLQRAFKAGLRLVVAQTVEDDQLCLLVPQRSHSCDETRTIELEVRRLRALEAYVDAQYGGAGRGWFRLVEGPREARRVIERGKLAVVIGAESSSLFGCGLRAGRATCTRADVAAGIARAKRLGVRALFVAHWFDNAFAGAALEGGDKGRLIEAMNRLRTGRRFATRRCPSPGQGEEIVPITRAEIGVLLPYFPRAASLARLPVPQYPSGRRCNARGLTRLGAFLVRRLMDAGMLIEVDHLSEPARAAVLEIARERRRPLVSSHTGTGGTWTPGELRRMASLGSVVSATSGNAPDLIEKLVGWDRLRRFRAGGAAQAVALGTDTGGFASLPGPRPRERLGPLRYPFRSFDGRVLFRRQRTGTRTFDLGADGVAHYGLIADLLADVQRRPGGREALRTLFGSAEAYLQAWERVAG
jgi:microsomal dipeptidase-like Zn-dependent dipeptidase